MSTENMPPELPERPPAYAPMAKHNPKDVVEIVVAGGGNEVRACLLALLRESRWTVVSLAPWSGTATKGNLVLNILFGAFAQRHKIGYAIFANPDGTTVVRVFRAASGIMGGLWGMHKVKRQFEEQVAIIQQQLAQRFPPAS